MKKKITAVVLLALFAAAAMLTGCSKDKNDRIAVATIDGEKITKSEYLILWKSEKNSNGITQDVIDDPESAEMVEELRHDVLDSLISENVAKIELENMGYYELTQEEHNTLKTQIESTLNNLLSYKQSEMAAELGGDYTEKEYTEAVNKYTELVLDEMGIDRKYVEDYYKYIMAMQKAESDLIDLSVTDEELDEYFDQRVSEDKETFSDLEAYEYVTVQYGYQPFYVPKGIRNVRHVLISFGDEAIAEIRTLRSNGDDEGADKLAETSREEIYDKAMDVLNQLNDGTLTFDEAISTYNEDDGMASYPEGYQMSLESVRYVQEFTDAGMALEKVGDISGLVATDFGYHIMEYYSDVLSGPVDFETVKEELEQQLIDIKRSDGWIALEGEWLAKHDIEYFYENLAEEPEESAEPAEAQ